MINILRTEDMSSAAGYADIQKYLDVPEFVDYMIDQIYAGNSDWPQHNWYADAEVDRTDPNHPVPVAGGQFRFFSWDSERILESASTNVTNLSGSGNDDGPGEIYTKLEANADFRTLFADRLHEFLFNNGILTPSKAAQLFSESMTDVDQAVVAESARWGDAAPGRKSLHARQRIPHREESPAGEHLRSEQPQRRSRRQLFCQPDGQCGESVSRGGALSGHRLERLRRAGI